MRLARVYIKNILGVEELEFTPGSGVTEISGGNRRGKSSVLKAIQSVMQGGHDATLIRNGEKEGTVVLELEEDDGTPAFEIRERVNDKGTVRTVRHPELGILSKPQTILSKLSDSLSANPIQFLTAPAKKRTEYLLEALPLKLTAKELAEALPSVFQPEHAGDLDRHALDVIDTLHRRYFDERQGENRAAREKRNTIRQLSAALPGGELPDPAAEIRHLEAQEQELREKARAEIHRIKNEAQAKILSIQTEADRKIAEIDRMIEALQKDRQEAERAAGRQVDAIMNETNQKEAAIIADGKEKVATIRGRIETLREQEKQAERVRATREVIDRLTREAEKHENASRRFTEALDALQALKLRLLENLPIKGVEVRDGEVYRYGIPFEHLSESERVQLAIEVAKLRAGKLKLACVDGVECMDPETYAEFVRQAQESDLQFVVTRVTKGDLSVGAPKLDEPETADEQEAETVDLFA